jgi:transposase
VSPEPRRAPARRCAAPTPTRPDDPRPRVQLVPDGNATGATSSRATERHCNVDVASGWLVADAAADYRSTSRLRRRHVAALVALLVQVHTLCAEAGS